MVGIPPTRQPDVAFVTAEHLPENLDGKPQVAPDLAVEIVSENDTIVESEAKVLQYQESKVRLVWVIHPFSQKVEVYRLGKGLIQEVIDKNGELSGEDVIPGFKVRVADLFPKIPVKK